MSRYTLFTAFTLLLRGEVCECHGPAMCVFTVYFETVSAFALNILCRSAILPLHFIENELHGLFCLEVNIVIQVLYFTYVQYIIIP